LGAGVNSAWGVSWLGSWGNSWGPLHEVDEGGGPGGHRKKKEERPKSKRVYIERDGKILVFAKPTYAAEFIAAEKAEKAQEATVTKKVTRKPVVKKVEPETVIEIDVLRVLAEKYELTGVTESVRNHDYETLLALHIHAMIMQEEEDIEILLMAI
jgi:hypothetical protein